MANRAIAPGGRDPPALIDSEKRLRSNVGLVIAICLYGFLFHPTSQRRLFLPGRTTVCARWRQLLASELRHGNVDDVAGGGNPRGSATHRRIGPERDPVFPALGCLPTRKRDLESAGVGTSASLFGLVRGGRDLCAADAVCGLDERGNFLAGLEGKPQFICRPRGAFAGGAVCPENRRRLPRTSRCDDGHRPGQ